MKTLQFKTAQSLNIEHLESSERELFDVFPEDYRLFLGTQNGGWLAEPESATYCVPIKGKFNDNAYDSYRTEVEEFWAYISYHHETPGDDKDAPSSILHEWLDRHRAEGFLPSEVFVIGRASRNSLFAISLADHDYGCIYHWDWYWRYPWHKPFFDERIAAAIAKFPGALEINEDPEHPEYEALIDAANYATLVKVADSFSEFLKGLRPKNSED